AEAHHLAPEGIHATATGQRVAAAAVEVARIAVLTVVERLPAGREGRWGNPGVVVARASVGVEATGNGERACQECEAAHRFLSSSVAPDCASRACANVQSEVRAISARGRSSPARAPWTGSRPSRRAARAA